MAKKRGKTSSAKRTGSGILAEEKKIELELEEVGQREDSIEKEERRLEEDTKKVVEIEREIKKEVSGRPLTRFSLKDINKGIIGAFIGVVAHFGFVYGREIAERITVARASLLFICSYILIAILMYETGYREIKEKRILIFFPRRATLIYLTSIAVVIAIFMLFDMVDLSNVVGFYKQVGVTSMLASLGAGTADLFGRH
ncbi:hypothetical protein J4212_04810 [Candidatus Woesearchaeota archaeon]|nr:hypothetical protein [Candidatus Woesearchaeota archaeon]